MTTAREQGERDIAFGRWRLQPARRRLLRDGEPVALGSRAFDVLLALAEARGALVTKDALLARVWPGVVVEENNLQVQVSALRRALGEDAAALIATVPGKGYCLTAPSEAPFAPPLAPLPVAALGQADGGRAALREPRRGPG